MKEFTLTARPPGIPLLAEGTCFRSAQILAIFRDGVSYCEGYARGADGELIHHGWLVDEHGLAVDPTWEDGSGYVGTVFPDKDALAARAVERGWFDPMLKCGGECACLYCDDLPVPPRAPCICEISRDDTGFAVTVDGWDEIRMVRVDGGDVRELARVLDDEMSINKEEE